MKHVCIISQYFTPDVGGAVTRVSNLLKILKSLGYKITIITAVPHYPNGEVPMKYREKRVFIEINENITVIRTPMPRIPHSSFSTRLVNYTYFVFLSLLVIPNVKDIDLIWVTSPNFFGNISGVMYKLIKRVPLILNVDDLWPDVIQELTNIDSKILLLIGNICNFCFYNFCDYITPISRMLKRKIMLKYKISGTKIYTVEVGLDQSAFEKKIKKFLPKKELNSNETRIILYSGILGPAYDFRLILKAFKILEEKFSNFQLIIHGKGPLENEIRLIQAKLNLNNVKMITKFIPWNEYLELLIQASCFLLPMKYGIFSETAIPAKLFTYLMINKPIVSTKGGEVERILTESNAGLTTRHNCQDLAQTLEEILTNELIYMEHCNNGAEYITKHYDLHILKEKVSELIQRAI